MSAPRILVAGIGNIFLRDDAFGSEVVPRLVREYWPAGVRVVDYGVGGIHLAYDLLDGYDVLVLVDAVGRGAPPGTVAVIEVDRAQVDAGGLDAHGMDPAAVLAGALAVGARLPRTLVVGCEPMTVEEGMGLSEPVAAAVPVAAEAVHDLVAAIGTGREPAEVVSDGTGRAHA